ncbi:MAG: hypothetical protein Unbinned3138contig1001_30 [Prokaryotic dsDNA virus sp.]|nr:MAG: hypothetical protein Unbinned3138contig1001_30 [Prokaryotic dsDNA virus sp.]
MAGPVAPFGQFDIRQQQRPEQVSFLPQRLLPVGSQAALRGLQRVQALQLHYQSV